MLKKKRTTIYVNPEVHRGLQVFCAKQGIPVSLFFEQAARKVLPKSNDVLAGKLDGNGALVENGY